MRGMLPRGKFAHFALLVLCVAVLSSCNSTKRDKNTSKTRAHINEETKFSSKIFGVKGSPRVTRSKRVRKGGGRYQVGKPYKIRGRWYKPTLDRNYVKTGMASWYGPNFHGRLTANGEVYDQYSLSAAHPTMPLPSYAEVTNLSNGSSVVVRVNDRGPYAHGRVIDLSARAAELLDYQHAGVTKVRVKYLGRAQMDGLDHRKLMASYSPGRSRKRNFKLPAMSAPQTMFASRRVEKTQLIAAYDAIPIRRPSPTLDRLLDGVPVVISAARIEYGVLEPLSYVDDTSKPSRPNWKLWEKVLARGDSR